MIFCFQRFLSLIFFCNFQNNEDEEHELLEYDRQSMTGKCYFNI